MHLVDEVNDDSSLKYFSCKYVSVVFGSLDIYLYVFVPLDNIRSMANRIPGILSSLNASEYGTRTGSRSPIENNIFQIDTTPNQRCHLFLSCSFSDDNSVFFKPLAWVSGTIRGLGFPARTQSPVSRALQV
jgi:hypothetical protein